MKAIGYIRRSKKSEDRTVSLAEQEQQIKAYCATKAFELAQLIRHDGVSGAKRSRFDEITKSLTENQGQVLVVYNLDRLARDASGLLNYLRLLTAQGIAVHEVGTGALDLVRSTGKLTVGVRGLMDEFFRDVISEKTIDALRYKRENGKRYTNLPPLGFVYQDGLLVEDPAEQQALIVVQACRVRGLGARRTQRELIRVGYRGRMSLGVLHKLLAGSL